MHFPHSSWLPVFQFQIFDFNSCGFDFETRSIRTNVLTIFPLSSHPLIDVNREKMCASSSQKHVSTTQIVNYCNFKEEHPEIHQDIRPLEMKYIGDDDVVSVPPYRTQCGRRIMIYRLGNWDPRKYSVEEIFKATIIILELGVLEPRAQILGGTVIFDLEGITMAHAWTITPQVILRLLYTLPLSLSLWFTSFETRFNLVKFLQSFSHLER